LGLASHVNLERLVSCLLQHCKRGGVLVITDGGIRLSLDLKYGAAGRKAAM
jgi:hypothetical protein